MQTAQRSCHIGCLEQAEIPHNAPRNDFLSSIYGDGNYCSRAISMVLFGCEEKYEKVHMRMMIGGVLRQEH